MAEKTENPVQNQERGERARQMLLQVALELFGESGFEGASTRAIAAKAKQNLGAISYYFGNKDGLYAAVLEDCLGRQTRKTDFADDALEALLNDTSATKDQYLDAMKQTVRGAVMAIAREDRQTKSFMKLMFREQFAPTDIFKRLYKTLGTPESEPFTRLVAAYLDRDPADTQTMLIAHALIGPYIGFRVAPEIVRIKAGWTAIGEAEAATMADIAVEQLELTITGLRARRG